MIPPHTNRYPKPPSGAATGWGRFFCVSDQGERAAAGGAAKPLRPRKLGQLPTAWGAFCAGKARERSLPSQGRWPRSRPEGFSPLTGSIAMSRAGHARPLRGATNGLRTRGAREGGSPPPLQWAGVAREWMATQGPSESPSHLTVTAPFDKGASLSPCGGSVERPTQKWRKGRGR